MARLTAPQVTSEHQIVLVINCGSSSLKAACFRSQSARQNFHYRIDSQLPITESFDQAFKQLFADLGATLPTIIAHRFVFGGHIKDSAMLITRDEQARLIELQSFAPLHMPLNLLGVDRCAEQFCKNKSISQWACFDNAFHYSLPELAYRFPIPKQYPFRRFGYHGLNYAHIAKQLPHILDSQTANGRIVVAHLGSGCSLCLLDQLRSVETSMGYSTAGGIPMATRSGDLDPGILLKLTESLNSEALNTLIFQHCGLLALSDGESRDMQTLLSSQSSSANFAVDYFTRSIRANIGAYAAKIGGIDALVFTGGIGEHAPEIRRRICDPLSFLGFSLCKEANASGQTVIHSLQQSKPILIIPADEEAEIAALVMSR